jgi:hypothetical protein
LERDALHLLNTTTTVFGDGIDSKISSKPDLFNEHEPHLALEGKQAQRLSITGKFIDRSQAELGSRGTAAYIKPILQQSSNSHPHNLSQPAASAPERPAPLNLPSHEICHPVNAQKESNNLQPTSRLLSKTHQLPPTKRGLDQPSTENSVTKLPSFQRPTIHSESTTEQKGFAGRSASCSIFDESTATLIGAASKKPSVDLKTFEWLAHNRESYEPSPVTADTMVDYLRSKHDHQAARNTGDQKAITSQAIQEAKIFTNASKSRGLIFSARQKLESERRRRFIDAQFAELDESSRFSSRYPILVNRGMWLSAALVEAGLISLALSAASVITRAKHGDRVLLIGNPELAWLVGSVVVLSCGIMLAFILLFKDGAFLCIKNRDIFGLHEVTNASPAVSFPKMKARYATPNDRETGYYYDRKTPKIGPTSRIAPARGIRQPGRDSFRNSTLVQPQAVHIISAPVVTKNINPQATKSDPSSQLQSNPRHKRLRVNTTDITRARHLNSSTLSSANSAAPLLHSPSSRYTPSTASPTPRSLTFPSPIHSRFATKNTDLRGPRHSTKLSRELKGRNMAIPLVDLDHDGSPITPGKRAKTFSMLLGDRGGSQGSVAPQLENPFLDTQGV